MNTRTATSRGAALGTGPSDLNEDEQTTNFACPKIGEENDMKFPKTGEHPQTKAFVHDCMVDGV